MAPLYNDDDDDDDDVICISGDDSGVSSVVASAGMGRLPKGCRGDVNAAAADFPSRLYTLDDASRPVTVC